jgi:hypothetical protein
MYEMLCNPKESTDIWKECPTCISGAKEWDKQETSKMHPASRVSHVIKPGWHRNTGSLLWRILKMGVSQACRPRHTVLIRAVILPFEHPSNLSLPCCPSAAVSSSFLPSWLPFCFLLLLLCHLLITYLCLPITNINDLSFQITKMSLFSTTELLFSVSY